MHNNNHNIAINEHYNPMDQYKGLLNESKIAIL